ncbi:MAG: nrdG [Clostridiaceae bacterium]|jgi:anaerobic ribonucleoside-triphosphate reductase activating protein|nr:nrdG [Clostridiaceae bacterium]
MEESNIRLQVAGFLDNSLVNGQGMRSVLFVSGCRHNCEGCHNREMQNFKYGDSIYIKEVVNRIKDNMPIIKGVTLSGGEPFEQAEKLYQLSKEIKALGLSIWCYTGYTFEQLIEFNDDSCKKLLECIDVLVDGKFEIDKKYKGLKYRGSSNQRIIDVKSSIKEHKIIEINY